MQGAKLVVIRDYGLRAEAELAESILRSEGIESLIQADTAGGMREHLAWSGAGFKVLVREEDAAVASDLLNPPPDAELPDTEPDSYWRKFT